MTLPSSRTIILPQNSELLCHDARQRSVLHKFTGLGAKRPVPSRLVGLACPIAFLATVALKFAANGGWRSTEQRCYRTDRVTSHHRARYFHAQTKSARISNDFAEPVLSRRSLSKYALLKGGFDQTTVRSAGGSHLSSSGPTLELFEFPCNRSVVFVSSATLLHSAYAYSSVLHRPVESAPEKWTFRLSVLREASHMAEERVMVTPRYSKDVGNPCLKYP